jgi:CheY-like chemotaxis protein
MKKPCTLFYVDEDGDDLQTFAEVCEDLGCNAMLFDTGQKMFDALLTTRPCVIFLDLNLRESLSSDVAASLKGDQRYLNIPIVIYTASKRERDVKEALLTGADLYLVKHFTYSQIRSAVRGALEQFGVIPDVECTH